MLFAELGIIAYAVIGLIFFGVMCVSVERDNAFWATVTLAATAVLLQVFTDLKPFTLILADPLRALVFLGIYLAAGTVWGVIKWAFYVYRVRDAYEVERTGYIAREKVDLATMTDVERRQMREAIERRMGQKLPLRASQHKSRIITWMGYWPVSAAWTLLHDPVTRFYAWVYARLTTMLQGISARAFSKFQGDFVD